jgi:insulysin
MPLTKQDVLDFYGRYIAPSSPHRAKLSVHLLAQSSPADIASSITAEEQSAKTQEAVYQLLSRFDITPDAEKLAAALKAVDVRSGDKDAIVGALSTYLQRDERLVDKAKLNAVLEQARALLTSALPAVGIETNPEVDADNANGSDAARQGDDKVVKGNGTEPIRIVDVHEWKAGMTVAPAARPMRDLSEFEEGSAKL